MSKKVISTLKKHMSLEERKRFGRNIKNKRIRLNKGEIDKMSLNNLMVYHSFIWAWSKEGVFYWNDIYSRFTPEELSYTINIKEL